MKALAVTTFNLSGFDLYGRKMIDTFHRFWCCDVKLRVYVEGWLPEEQYPDVEYADLRSSSDWLASFQRRNKGRNKSNSYRHDAVRFSHKVAALLAAAQDESLDYLIWLDGDIATHSDVDFDVLKSLLPDSNQIIAWLDRKGWYPEMGFYILNCRHPKYKEFIARYRNIYVSDSIFELDEWHDCFAAQHILNKMGLLTKSLSGPGFRTDHPLVHGPLGQWFDHAKGMRKVKGRTPKGEVNRTEPYWAK